MSAVFCFYARSSERISTCFKSTTDEEYDLVASTFVGNPKRSHVKIKWEGRSSKFIKIDLSIDNGSITNSQSKFISDANTASLSIGCSNCSARHVAHIITIYIHPVLSFPKPVPQQAAEKMSSASSTKWPVSIGKIEELSTDMNNLLQTGNSSDVVLTDGYKEIRAHKLILSARSSVFAKMLNHPMKENLENRILINDMRFEALSSLLQFIYSGTSSIVDFQMARELYIAADKYDVSELGKICSAILKSVDVSNALEIIILADVYGDVDLKKSVLNFITNNYSRLKQKPSWNAFMNEHHMLAIEVLNYVIDNK